jgi:fatty-acid desaturase
MAIGGSVRAGLTGLLWGGAVRLFVLHHVTYSINSICHVFGRRRFRTSDESRNVFWLALPSFGESWHNNHHAFPTSACTASTAGSSIRPRSSSGAWRPVGSRGTWCA